jgi:hypothetical protein
MRIIKLFAIILVVSLILLVGCAKKECDSRTDCIAGGKCSIPKCVKGVCDYSTKLKDCVCGNNQCDDGTKGTQDKGENSCSCTADCGVCSGDVGEFMQKSCIGEEPDKECVTDIKKTEKRTAEDTISVSGDDRLTKFELLLKASYDYPFNIRKSLFNVNLGVKKIYSGTTDLKIKRVRIIQHTAEKDRYGTREGDNPVGLADKEYSKPLLDETSVFNKEFPILIESMEKDTDSAKDTTLEITYEYKSFDRWGTLQETTGTYEKDIQMVFVNPSQEVKCPVICDDKNDCTKDDCINYFCEHTLLLKGTCCGDDVCSPGEDRCKCPQDCGICSGDIGQYMAMGCVSNSCLYTVRNPASLNPSNKVTEFTFGSANLAVKIAYDYPFSKKDSVFTFTFEPKSFANTRNVIMKKVMVLSGDNLLGESALSTPLSESSPIQASIRLSAYSTQEAEEKKQVSIKFEYSYESQDTRTMEWTVVPYGTNTYELGELILLNPS